MKKRKLPIGGVQTFTTLRDEYDVYVDKTEHIYNMVDHYKTVFLSRPRRFGKSLLCSTIKALFQNKRELFEGLAITKTDWKWQEYPVIYLDFSLEDFNGESGLAALVKTVNRQLNMVCAEYDIVVNESEFISDRLGEVLYKLSKVQDKVVVVVDEYDNPLLSTIDNPELNQRLRDKLRGLYGTIKGSEEFIKFVFITGITKFAQLSMFTAMNQPKDISTMPAYSDICGITQAELEHYFIPEIDEYSKKYGGRENYLKKLHDYYNGYYFTREKKSVYNTYGILSHLADEALFSPYWSNTGTPSFIVKYLENKNIDIIKIEDAQMEESYFTNSKDDTISLFPLLYQAGYLTIKDYDESTGLFTLNYPNIEIRKAFAKFLADHYSMSTDTLQNSTAQKFISALDSGDVDAFMEILKWYLHTVDYSLSSKITEYYFEFAVSNIINLLGFQCKNEVHTSTGRIDSVILTNEIIYIIEFKVDKPIETAMWQIEKKDYGLYYAQDSRKKVKVGVVFNREQRNILQWKVES